MTLLCRLRGADRHIVRRRLLLSIERAGLTTREIDSAVGAERRVGFRQPSTNLAVCTPISRQSTRGPSGFRRLLALSRLGQPHEKSRTTARYWLCGAENDE
jgi:hypothetical protein